MGRKYYIEARLNGYCKITQESEDTNSLFKLIFLIFRYKIKYPIIDVRIRDGYRNCEKCEGYQKYSCSLEEDE